jgi:hypothetical protein
MTATLGRYKAPPTPEWYIKPINACRLSVLTTARGFETLGEAYIRRNGTPYTLDDRVTLMRALRRQASKHRGESPAVAKGYSRDDAIYAYRKVFPTGWAQSVSPLPSEMWEMLTKGWFLSVSGNVDDVPGSSKLDDKVNDVPHEIGLAPFPKNGKVRVYEPMRPVSQSPIWVDWSDIKKFSSEFATNGRRVCIRIKAGADTARAQLAETTRAQIERKNERIDELRLSLSEASATVAVLTAEVKALTEQLAECRDDGCDAAVEAILDDLEAWITEKRL